MRLKSSLDDTRNSAAACFESICWPMPTRARYIPWPKVAPPPLPPEGCTREEAFRLQNAWTRWRRWTMRLIERHYDGVMTDARLALMQRRQVTEDSSLAVARATACSYSAGAKPPGASSSGAPLAVADAELVHKELPAVPVSEHDEMLSAESSSENDGAHSVDDADKCSRCLEAKVFDLCSCDFTRGLCARFEDVQPLPHRRPSRQLSAQRKC